MQRFSIVGSSLFAWCPEPLAANERKVTKQTQRSQTEGDTADNGEHVCLLWWRGKLAPRPKLGDGNDARSPTKEQPSERDTDNWSEKPFRGRE
jgi:hypothetical protein